MQAEDKNKLRTNLKLLYRQHDLSEYVESCIKHIQAYEVFIHATSVLSYEPIASLEVPFVHRLRELYPEKKWYMPEVVGEGEMMFVDAELFTFSKSTCVIVPSLALDSAGNRLGKGGGYYDRFLAEHPSLQSKTVSLVPDFAQLRETYVPDSHDIPVACPLFAIAA
jgi:5-formyltetrahydrofolate cyclo-ligase